MTEKKITNQEELRIIKADEFNGQTYDNEWFTFDNLKHCENHLLNRWYYLAFCILDDPKHFGINGNFYCHDPIIDDRFLLKLVDFLKSSEINNLSDVESNKESIREFFK